MLARKIMIDRAIAYFSDVDRLEPDPIMTHLTSTIVLEVPSHGVFKSGSDDVRRSDQTTLARAACWYAKSAQRVASSTASSGVKSVSISRNAKTLAEIPLSYFARMKRA